MASWQDSLDITMMLAVMIMEEKHQHSELY